MSDVVLEARDVSFRYRPDTPLLEHWSAVFHGGTTTAVTGPSGRGKSTLLYLLGLMLRARSGDILLDGESLTRRRDSELARRRADDFGFVFQDAALDHSRTVLDNVTETALYRGHSRASVTPRALTLLERFGVDLPPGRKPNQVSGGQGQRIALCRALLNEPRIVLADEPTGNLDPESARLVTEALHEQARRGAAVIIVTHSVEIAASCEREIRL